MSEELQKSYYPDGTLRNELPLKDGIPHGIRRGWHPNGVLAEEVPLVSGRLHGISRFWNRKGELLGENHVDHGTGLVRTWHENGQMKTEGQMNAGIAHGRVRAWSEDGKLISEAYWINGRQVSGEKYFETCTKDSSLPRYENEKSSGPHETESRLQKQLEKIRRVSEEEKRFHRERVDRLLKTNAHEALEWVKQAPAGVVRTIGDLPSPEASTEWIREAYASGAKEVIAVDIQPPLEGKQCTDRILLGMPRDKRSRRKLINWSNNQAELQGYGGDVDWGQKYIFFWFD